MSVAVDAERGDEHPAALDGLEERAALCGTLVKLGGIAVGVAGVRPGSDLHGLQPGSGEEVEDFFQRLCTPCGC